MKTLYLDCFCGISGDMTVGALLDVGANVETVLDAVRALSLEGVSVAANKITKHGIQATKFDVDIAADVHQPHRHLRHILEIIDKAPLPDAVKQGASGTFSTLGAAEAEVHGVPVEKVHFHEVGAADSIVDIVAANMALHLLGVERVISSPVIAGSGVVSCDHGVMPVPAPATALLLRDIPWSAGDVAKEMTTPTGAALVRHWADAFDAMPTMTVHGVGYGAGARDLPDRANVLRVFLGEAVAQAPGLESICVIETMIDDMNAEYLALLIPAAMQAGARDAYITPVIAKKGRPGHCVTALCDAGCVNAVMQALFENSGTLGMRVREEKRRVLARTIKNVNTPWGVVPVKAGLLGDKVHCVAPEFEQCRATAEKCGVPPRRVHEAALAAALRGDFLDE